MIFNTAGDKNLDMSFRLGVRRHYLHVPRDAADLGEPLSAQVGALIDRTGYESLLMVRDVHGSISILTLFIWTKSPSRT